MINFPYAISDFHLISTGGYFYIDRTDRIPLIENAGNQLLFIRPRRFGKTMLLSMLENYYDLARAEQFDQVFGHLAIGKKPTPLHNRYFVMKWDFSQIEPAHEYQKMRQSTFHHLNEKIELTADKYAQYLPRPVRVYPDDALASFESLMGAIQLTSYKLYLLIDEYDNFANEVLTSHAQEGHQRYAEIVQGEGFLKTLFKTVKSATSGQGLERVFITGVSPLVVSDMASGYNVAENLYMLPKFVDLCGFTEAEVTHTLDLVCQNCQFSAEKRTEILQMMQTFYNGYRFSMRRNERIYNPTLTLYFLKALQEDCLYPEEMLDSNLSMDHSRLAYIARLGGAKQLILAALNEAKPLTTTSLAQRFGVKDLMSSTPKSKNYLAAILYYFGMLTLSGRGPLQEYILTIPNLVIRQLYIEQLRELFLPDRQADDEIFELADDFFLQGNLQPLCAFAEQRLFSTFDNRDYLTANELTIKTSFLCLLFNDKVYIIDSETAIRRTYADLTLMLRPDLRYRQDLYDFIIEFKYIKLGDIKIQETPSLHPDKPTFKALDGIIARQMSQGEVTALPEVQAKLTEARTQLRNYRRDLEVAYGATLRLRTYTIVAIGFDRLIWEEVYAT